MKATKDLGYDRLEPTQAMRALWTVLIVTSGICLSTFFACATPFAALATLAVLKLARRDAVVVVGLMWLANQAIGYGFLGYPWTWDSAAWGLADWSIGLPGRAFAARGTIHRPPGASGCQLTVRCGLRTALRVRPLCCRFPCCREPMALVMPRSWVTCS